MCPLRQMLLVSHPDPPFCWSGPPTLLHPTRIHIHCGRWLLLAAHSRPLLWAPSLSQWSPLVQRSQGDYDLLLRIGACGQWPTDSGWWESSAPSPQAEQTVAQFMLQSSQWGQAEAGLLPKPCFFQMTSLPLFCFPHSLTGFSWEYSLTLSIDCLHKNPYFRFCFQGACPKTLSQIGWEKSSLTIYCYWEQGGWVPNTNSKHLRST